MSTPRPFLCTYAGERGAINRDAYTNMSPVGVVFHGLERGARTVSAQKKGEEKCFTRRSNGADLFRTETPWLGAIEVFNDEDGEVFEASRAVW